MWSRELLSLVALNKVRLKKFSFFFFRLSPKNNDFVSIKKLEKILFVSFYYSLRQFFILVFLVSFCWYVVKMYSKEGTCGILARRNPCHFDQSIETKLRLSSPGVAPCAIILQIAGMTFGIIKKYIFTNYLLHDSLLRLKLQEIQNNIVIYWPKLTKTFFSVYLVGLDYPRFLKAYWSL